MKILLTTLAIVVSCNVFCMQKTTKEFNNHDISLLQLKDSKARSEALRSLFTIKPDAVLQCKIAVVSEENKLIYYGILKDCIEKEKFTYLNWEILSMTETVR